MSNCEIKKNPVSLQDSISQARTLNELAVILRNADGYQPLSYRNYVYPAFGGEPIYPKDISYFKAYEDGLDISSVCFDILSWNEENILFIIGYGMILDLAKNMIVAAKVPQPENYDYWITKREFVEKFSVDIVCPLCSKVNRIMPDYSVEKCEHAVASHVYGQITWHNREIQKSIEGFDSELIPIITTNMSDDSIPEEDENGVRNNWSVLEDVVSALEYLYPKPFFKEDAAYGLGYCDEAGFAFLPREVLSKYQS